MTNTPAPRAGQPILFKDGIVLTMDDDSTVLPRGDVLVVDGKIAEVGKKWFRVRDTYGVQVAPGQDDALVLAVTIVVDSMSHATK